MLWSEEVVLEGVALEEVVLEVGMLGGVGKQTAADAMLGIRFDS